MSRSRHRTRGSRSCRGVETRKRGHARPCGRPRDGSAERGAGAGGGDGTPASLRALPGMAPCGVLWPAPDHACVANKNGTVGTGTTASRGGRPFPASAVRASLRRPGGGAILAVRAHRGAALRSGPSRSDPVAGGGPAMGRGGNPYLMGARDASGQPLAHGVPLTTGRRRRGMERPPLRVALVGPHPRDSRWWRSPPLPDLSPTRRTPWTTMLVPPRFVLGSAGRARGRHGARATLAARWPAACPGSPARPPSCSPRSCSVAAGVVSTVARFA
jgi:hypothetical protein